MPNLDDPGFIWDGKLVETHLDVMACVRDICRLYEEGYDVDMIALEFIDDYGTYIDHLPNVDGDGRKIAQDNIGYMAGDESPELRGIIFEIFRCEHPVFGLETPTPEEAFEAGKRMAMAFKAKESDA